MSPRTRTALLAMAALCVVAAQVARVTDVFAGGFGVGSGGLQGAPAGASASGSGSQLGPGCVTTATGIYCGTVDAGVVFVQGQFCANANQLCATAAGVLVANDFTVTTGNNAVFQGSARINGDVTLDGVKLIQDTAPTVAACTGAAVVWNNRSAVFEFDVGTGCAVSTATVTFGEAVPNGFSCHCENFTTADRELGCLSGSTTTIVCSHFVRTSGAASNFADGANIRCHCFGG